jgi:dTDP-4-amino-4,6-dideoxygalactose transaminase
VIPGSHAAHAAELPLADLRRQHQSLARELQGAFRRVLGHGAFVLGEEVERFEEEFAAACGVRHCVGVASGTAGLALALLAGGLRAGDEVIVPAHTYVATALAVHHAGGVPVFCDVERDTGLIDVDAVRARLSGRTAAIVPVHLYGQVCDMGRLRQLARERGLLLVEDAAQAHGASWGTAPAGALGDAAAFSFYPSKNLGALGDGGAICTGDGALAAHARRLRNLGQRRKGEHVETGFNERLDELQAALLRVKLPHLEDWNRARRAHAARYRALLPESLLRLREEPRGVCVYHLFPVRVAQRGRFRAQLRSRGIATGLHYTPCVPDLPPFAGAPGASAEFPEARSWAAQEVSLPMFPELTVEEVKWVAQAAAAALEQEAA